MGWSMGSLAWLDQYVISAIQLTRTSSLAQRWAGRIKVYQDRRPNAMAAI
jgi:hypothetical protein